jgi:hypothetical protein
MSVRAAILATALFLPSIASAQLPAPRVGGGHPTEPVPLGTQPEVITRSLALVRSRYSVEAYPLFSRVEASAPDSRLPATRWTSFGTGARLDWRHSDYLSWTIDLTASYVDGSALAQTAEIGTRIRPENWNSRVRPFADLRVGFEHINGSNDGFVTEREVRYGRGFGALAGAGVEYFLTNTTALTTAMSAMRSSMSAYNFNGLSAPTPESSYRMTSYRLTVGLKYNPVRYLTSTNQKMP